MTILFILLYLALGLGLGETKFKEYHNDILSEGLSFWQKIRRILLFPNGYFVWSIEPKKNEEQQREDAFYNHKVSDLYSFGWAYTNKPAYLVANLFLWPLQLIPLLGGLLISIFYIPYLIIGQLPTRPIPNNTRNSPELISAPVPVFFSDIKEADERKNRENVLVETNQRHNSATKV